ncbi:hypothetical protein SAY87_020760 [Trapa incisa]|uniref:U-box domain-containing protein n=1 Tax=Trapa incisa TaxID=236973 RepID=A0AAN7JQM4_9MYRT|nr:hypothetical protein SAY87_020760 [Trapa incisa]
MARGEELYITVPSMFRCPISLDVMKSPVSLSTGVTYDRSSIQQWLDSGHDTCPATNQPLLSKDYVPNLTLHRLINTWTHSSAASSSMHPLHPEITSGEIRQLVSGISRRPDAAGVDELEKIVRFASYCEENRRFIANLHDSIEVILRILIRDNERVEFLESIVRLLDLILLENGVRERIQRLIFKSDHEKCFDSFLSILKNGKLSSKVQSTRILELIASTNDSRQRTIGEKIEATLPVLVHLMRTETDKHLMEAILSCLISLSTSRSIKVQLVHLKLVPILSRILSDPETASPTAERAIKTLHLLSTVAEGRTAIAEDSGCAVAVLDKLMKVQRKAKEEGVALLWSMCCGHRDARVRERVGKENGVTKMLVVMQSEGDDGIVRRMCGDLVKVLRGIAMAESSSSYGQGGLGSLETKTTHIKPY